MQKMRIGVLDYRMDFYNNLRIILNQLPEAAYIPVRDIYSYRRAVALKLNRVIGKPLFPTFDLNNQFEDFDLNKVDVLHFSNGISYEDLWGNKIFFINWCKTFKSCRIMCLC